MQLGRNLGGVSMDATQVILFICGGGGLVIVAGCIWLLAKQRIYLDKESNATATELQLPLGIKLKTATPVIALFVVGAGLLIYAANQASEHAKHLMEQGSTVDVRGAVSGDNESVALYAALVSTSLPGSGPFSFAVPKPHPNHPYTLLYLVDGRIVAHQLFDPAVDNARSLDKLEISAHSSADVLAGDIMPRPAGF